MIFPFFPNLAKTGKKVLTFMAKALENRFFRLLLTLKNNFRLQDFTKETIFSFFVDMADESYQEVATSCSLSHREKLSYNDNEPKTRGLM